MATVRSVKMRGRALKIPFPLNEKQSEGLGLKWLIAAARKKKKPMYIALADEILLASQNQGDAVKKRDQVTADAVESRAFSHYRW